MDEGQYIYCLIETGEARNFGAIGIGNQGDAVTTIAYRDLSAVVSRVPMTKYVVSKETIISHEKVIEMVMRDYTVLPVRFYTVAPNAEEIRTLLRRRYQEFKKLFRELDNKVELGLKALWKDMNAVFGEIAEENDDIKAVGALAAETGRDKDAADERGKPALEHKKAEEGQAILQPLRRVAADSCLNRTYGDDMILNAAFLVDRAREKEFDSEVEKIAAQHENRIELKYVGPAPPYSFVNIVVRE